ncbi:alkaline phosphatase family protein [Metallumcola ferriviriculae]|uniref:Alkaline phosphatase family protein n=1 Tax=Metallumcola ferriviriculae TaxID=3039180 RepID=A0AAU0UPK7_9FIRM|nr:alkaline phosphatase family protein [Desulfitibacteraceae bacterium MK1]
MKVILLFIDGLGLGDNSSEANPYCEANTPFLNHLMGGHKLYREVMPISGGQLTIKGIDAALGVEGIPQSATGQAAIWTGVNAPAELGYHLNGLPNAKLKRIISRDNIYLKLQGYGKAVTFANAYRPAFFTHGSGHISVSTHAAQAAGLKLRTMNDLKCGNAVYQDITNQLLCNYGYVEPLVSPTAAGRNLVRISQGFDFTVFEYFQTDIAGHKDDWNRVQEIWQTLDEFIAAVVNGIDLDSTLVILTSDHGNIEDFTIKGHTRNMVPLIGIGRNHELLLGIKDISGIASEIEKIIREDD